jgi:hypothetical protein
VHDEGGSEIQRGNTAWKYGENLPLEVVTWRGVSAVFARCILLAVFSLFFKKYRGQIQRKYSAKSC